MCQDYRITIREAKKEDFVYCDPPYIGRHVDYYDSWDEESEESLLEALESAGSRFMLSTWHSNEHRENQFLQTLWKGFEIVTQEHFYHVGAHIENRKPMIEALVTNYVTSCKREDYHRSEEQLMLFEKARGVPGSRDCLAGTIAILMSGCRMGSYRATRLSCRPLEKAHELCEQAAVDSDFDR